MIKLPRVTVEEIMEWEPCDEYDEKRLEDIGHVLGQDSINALEILELAIPAEDRIWAVLREEMMPVALLREAACQFAESVLHLYEEKHPDDKRPREAIDAGRAFNRGEITAAAGDAAGDAAGTAARAAAGTAARAAGTVARADGAAAWAASRAAGAASRDASRDAAWDAAWAADLTAGNDRTTERNLQIEILKKLTNERMETNG